MIYEIFDCRTGQTLGHRHGLERTLQTLDRLGGAYDYLPARPGLYGVDGSGNAHPYPRDLTLEQARARCDMRNMASDTTTHSVVIHDV